MSWQVVTWSYVTCQRPLCMGQLRATVPSQTFSVHSPLLACNLRLCALRVSNTIPLADVRAGCDPIQRLAIQRSIHVPMQETYVIYHYAYDNIHKKHIAKQVVRGEGVGFHFFPLLPISSSVVPFNVWKGRDMETERHEIERNEKTPSSPLNPGMDMIWGRGWQEW
eukprot:2788973-Amphidinium_carterae.1